jgi:hypothetical protein
VVQPGFYSDVEKGTSVPPGPGLSTALASRQVPCPTGYYCVGGARVGCPPRTYQDQVRRTDPGDCLDCPAGYVCGTNPPFPSVSSPLLVALLMTSLPFLCSCASYGPFPLPPLPASRRKLITSHDSHHYTNNSSRKHVRSSSLRRRQMVLSGAVRTCNSGGRGELFHWSPGCPVQSRPVSTWAVLQRQRCATRLSTRHLRGCGGSYQRHVRWAVCRRCTVRESKHECIWTPLP